MALFKSLRITFVQKGLGRPMTFQISFGDHFFLSARLKVKIAFICLLFNLSIVIIIIFYLKIVIFFLVLVLKSPIVI